MVKQLEREVIDKYTWLERANLTSGYGVNLLFDFADLDELCKDIEGELDSKSIGAGFLSQGQRIDEFAEHRCSLLTYINDVLYDIDSYLEDPLYKGFNEAVDLMATIDMTNGKTNNTLGVQKNVTVNGGGRGYGFEVELPELNLEDFIGSRYEETRGSSYERSTYNQKVDDFADLFAKDYEDLVNSGKIDSDEKSLQKYLDELILREFAHKKDAPFWKELLGQLSDLTIVIPIYEAATGKTLITGDYLTNTEGAFKLVSATVSLVTLGQGALASKGGVAFAKLFAAEVVSEAAAGTTVIVCDKAGVPSAVTISLAMLLGTTAGMAANKALIPEGFSKWMTKEEASRYNQYWSDVQGRQGLKDYDYYSVLEDGYYKDLAVAGNYKNFDFFAFEINSQEINRLMQTSANKKTLEILENQSKTAAGPCLSEIYDPLTGKIAYGQNFKTSATGNIQYYQWLENDADPLIKKLVSKYETKIKNGEVTLSETADYRLAAHSEIVALDEILKNRRALGIPVNETSLSELYLQNIDLTKAYKTGEIVPKIRCEHCRYLTDGINILNHN